MSTVEQDSESEANPTLEEVNSTRFRRAWQEHLPDPRELFSIFMRNKLVFGLTALLVVGVVTIWYVLQTPIYSAASSVLVQARSETVVDIQSVSPELPPTADIVDTQVRLIQSADIAERVADRFADEVLNESLATEAERSELAQGLLNTVEVSRVGSTYVIEIVSRATEPDQAAAIANLFAEESVEANRDAKRSANSNASEWLTSRIATLEEEAQSAESALQTYRIQNGLISSTGTTLAEQQISNLEQEIAQAEADLAEKQGRLTAARNQLSRGSGGADVGAALGSGTIGTLRAREAETSARVAELTSEYGELYPPLRSARGELADIREQIQLEINRILSNLEADVRVASSRLSSLRASRGRSVGELATSNAAAVELAELQRRADAADAVYQTFLNRLRETSAQEGLQQADLRVAERADIPAFPETPKTNVALLLALIGGGLAGTMSVGVAEYLKGGIQSKADVEKRLKIRYAGALPTLASTLDGMRQTEDPHEYIVNHPQSLFSESFRVIRAFLMLGGSKKQATSRVVSIASALPREGKSTTSICLAQICALGGSPTIIVDCDLRRRGASEMLEYNNEADLISYLDGEATLEEAVQIEPQTGLAILGISKFESEQTDPFSSENIAEMLAELRQTYRIIILDTAPVLGIADARLVASAADRVLMIAKWKETSIHATEAAIEILLEAGAKLSGLAMSQVDAKKYASSGYGEAIGYAKKFKGYYVD